MIVVGLSLITGIATFWLAAWIYLPAPNYFLLMFTVGGPEVSHWTILAAVIGAALAALNLGASRVAQVALGLNILAVVLAAGVWIRVPGTLSRFETETRSRIATPRAPLRTKPIVFADLFRGVPAGQARLSRRVQVDDIDGLAVTADIYAPTRHGLFPIVVQIYGGRWQGGQPSDNARFANWLASAGYVVVAIDYRHAPTFTWPIQIIDVGNALKWVAAHATDYDGDTSRVALIGRSAGGHLATYAAWFLTPIHLRGVISLYGPADLLASYESPPHPDPIHVREVEEALIGGPPSAELRAFYENASPLRLLPGVEKAPVPSLLIYGARDHIVEPKYGAALRAALVRAGGEVSYLEIPWADHAFDEVFSGPSGQITLYYVERFLAKVMR